MPARATLALVALTLAACGRPDQETAAAADPACFGSRVLSFQDLVAEVVIPSGEQCDRGSFVVHFTRGADTVASLVEERVGTVGFIGTADVDGDGRGEFFVATSSLDGTAQGALFAYTETAAGLARLGIAPLDEAQRSDHAGGDRFGFGGTDRLVRTYARASGDSVWLAYRFADARWMPTTRPDWLR